ncbi:hypothetical protein N7505_007293 [Penicillium chrysogenum]|uniref:Uncharacterized protein n=1 Tax=Penicillium chrysogenum TaxID=5076 RepID=A0ABQ8WD20_PENCH|nr:hypothetical protein N7505_007293 [Penicillium chrysogenum]
MGFCGSLYESAFVYVLAVLGRTSYGWKDTHSYPPILLKILKIARFIVLHKALLLDPYMDNLIASFRGQFNNPALFAETPFNEPTYILSGIPGCVTWTSEDRILYKDIHFTMRDFRAFIHGLVHALRRILYDELLICEAEALPPIPWDTLVDDPAQGQAGWSFLKDPRTKLPVTGSEWMMTRVSREAKLQRLFLDPRKGLFRTTTIRSYLRAVVRFREKLSVAVHLTGGQPARAPELLSADLPVATRIPASSLPPTLARFPLSHPSLSHPSSSRGERVSLNTVLVAGPAIPVVTQDSLFSSSLDLGLGTYLGLGRRRLYFSSPVSSLFFILLSSPGGRVSLNTVLVAGPAIPVVTQDSLFSSSLDLGLGTYLGLGRRRLYFSSPVSSLFFILLSSPGERVSLNTVLVAGPAIPVVTQDSLFSSSLDLGLGTYLGLGRRRLYFSSPVSSLFFILLSSPGGRVSLNTVLVAGPAIPVVTQDSLFSSSLDLGLGTYLGLGRRRLYFFTPISSLFFFNLPYTSLGCSQCMRGRCY